MNKQIIFGGFAILAVAFLVLRSPMFTGDAVNNEPAVLGEETTIEESNLEQQINMADTIEMQWDEPPANILEEGKKYFANIKTNQGTIKLELFAEQTPVTVNNFVFLANEGFYNGVIFHRVIDGFMIQGGDPTGTGMGGPGYRFEDEIDIENNSNEPFTISMANAGPNTNGSQFFINVNDNAYLNDKHTVFGKVVEGEDIVNKISTTPTGAMDKPLDDVVMESVEIVFE